MIRPIDIRLNAAHPELPLAEAVTFTGSPSTVLIRGVPPNCGRWAITAVFVAATYPDGSTTTRAAVQSANGVWVATLPATARSGRTANGLRVLADGIDENGAAVTGYILGVADFAVASLGVTPAPEPGETSWQMLYFDAVPGTLRKGDVAKVDGVLKLYNGTAWEPFAGDIPAPSTATPAMDGTGAAGTSAAFARGDHVHPTDTSRVPTSRKVNGKALSSDVTLTGADIAVSGSDATKISAALAGKASTADATLNERGYTAWELSEYTAPEAGGPIVIRASGSAWYPCCLSVCGMSKSIDSSTTSVTWAAGEWTGGYPMTAERANASSAWVIVTPQALQDGYEIYSSDGLSPFMPVHPESYGSVKGNAQSTSLTWAGAGPNKDWPGTTDLVATRTALQGYQLGSQTDKPLASEAEAEALRTGKQNALSAQQLANIAAVPNKANDADVVHKTGAETIAGAKTFTDSTIMQSGLDVPWIYLYQLRIMTNAGWVYVPDAENGTLALTADLRYALTTKTIANGAVSLDDRAINAVAVSSSLASLTVNFPTATSGKARDFGLRLTVASGITTAPELALPQGVVCENEDGTAPEIGADGAATILYFTETASGVFLVKGEVVQTIS